MGIPVLIAEPELNQLNDVNRLSGAYNIQVAIHNHPAPDIYWHPDSVVLAMKRHANIYACEDIGHWALSGLNVVDFLK
jgi:sugar phosphate isomerase/epimerase